MLISTCIYIYIGMENYSSCFLVNDKLLQTKLLCGPLTWVCRLWPHKRIARLCFSFLVKEIVQSYLNTQLRGCQMLMLTNAYENINLWVLEILQTFSVASEMLSNFGYVWKLGKVWGSQLIIFSHVPQTVTVFGPF